MYARRVEAVITLVRLMEAVVVVNTKTPYLRVILRAFDRLFTQGFNPNENREVIDTRTFDGHIAPRL